MWDLNCKDNWASKNWWFWTVVLEKTLESPLDCKEFKSVLPKGNQSWVFIGRTDLEAETSILCPRDAKSWLTWKDPDAGKDWRQEEKEMTEDEMVGWHHRLNGLEFGWTLGVGDGQGGLTCCGPWGCKDSDTTERLDWTEWFLEYDSKSASNKSKSRQVKLPLRSLYIQKKQLTKWKGNLWNGRKYLQTIYQKKG